MEVIPETPMLLKVFFTFNNCSRFRRGEEHRAERKT